MHCCQHVLQILLTKVMISCDIALILHFFLAECAFFLIIIKGQNDIRPHFYAPMKEKRMNAGRG